MEDLRRVPFEEIRARLSGDRRRVYEALAAHGPRTCIELAAALQWPVTSVRPRVTELRKMFHAEATGRRRNGENVFRACDETWAAQLHRAAAREAATGRPLGE
jgi:predicted ArsR family transcriptional regulator